MKISFGTDGIRGAANRELTAEVALRVGRAYARILRGRNGGRARPILIGKDTRLSGDMIQGALVAGICSMGVDAMGVGVIPTGGLAWLTRRLDVDGGIMISASHNPIADNGIKVFGGDGYKLGVDVEAEIERLALADQPEGEDLPVGEGVGRFKEACGERDAYIRMIGGMLAGVKFSAPIVVDAANGSASPVAREAFGAISEKTVFINDAGDGALINVDCGSTEPGRLKKAVIENGAALGFAFDGDADRVLFVDETGELIDGDQIMLICAGDMMASGKLKDNTVVASVMSNMGFEGAIRNLGGRIVRAPVGDKHVLSEMRQNGYGLGGEQSGHIIFLDLATTGDGLITAAQTLKIAAASGKPLSELAAIKRSSQFLKNLEVVDKEGFDSNAVIDAKVKEVTERLGDSGRVVVRPSGTEPLIRVMVETWDSEEAESCTDEILETIGRELGVKA